MIKWEGDPAELNWPKGYTIPCNIVLCNKTGEAEEGGGFVCQGGHCSETGKALVYLGEVVSYCHCITWVPPPFLWFLNFCLNQKALLILLFLISPVMLGKGGASSLLALLSRTHLFFLFWFYKAVFSPCEGY